MSSRLVCGLVVVLLWVSDPRALRGQDPSGARFDVASVKRVNIPANDRGVPVFPAKGGVGTSDPSRISYRGTWLVPLIANAFGVRFDQVIGPGWLGGERYDIDANIPEGTTKEQFNIMMGNLLRDRFHLQFHFESRTIPVYALRLGKNGPKLKATTRRDSDGVTAASTAIGAPDAQGCPSLPSSYKGMLGRGNSGASCWVAQDVPISELLGLIERPAGRPVIDETQLKGSYDFKIRFDSVGRVSSDATDAVNAPSVFTALQEQLGLKLESATAPIRQFIIDSIDKEPGDN